MKITVATLETIPHIRQAAQVAFFDTYLPFISAAQVSYMFEMMYAENALQNQMLQRGDVFLIAQDDAISPSILGFASFQYNFNPGQTKLHKLYILPSCQGKNIGAQLINSVERFALQNQQKSVLLNVNRYNKAVGFYQKMDYQILREDDIDIGSGYFMNDYEMIKSLPTAIVAEK